MARARCRLKVKGLDCSAEAVAIEAALKDEQVDLEFDPAQGIVAVSYDPEKLGPRAIIDLIEQKAGMLAEEAVAGAAGKNEPGRRLPLADARLLGTIASGLLLGTGVLCESGLRQATLAGFFYLAAVVAGGIDPALKAWRSGCRGRLDIHVLMSLAIVGALVLRQWDEAATVAFLFGLSETLESFGAERARRAVRAVLEIAPETAERFEADGSCRVVDARTVAVGERVRVRAGQRVPVDGLVVAGRSNVDQKMVTGESVPVDRGPGDEVFAGTVNGEGSLEVEATRPAGSALIDRIVEQVRDARSGRAPIERTIERFASRYTPGVVALALAVLIAPPLANLLAGRPAEWSSWLSRALVVLVTACPCALVIATPVAVLAALASAARKGVLIKGGRSLEELGRLKVLAFDKTGTLTRGEPDVVEVVPTLGRRETDLLRIAAALGDQGGHVLGRAIARHARTERLDVPAADGYQAVPGLGASATVEDVRYHMGNHRFLDEAGLCAPEFHDSMGQAEGRIGTAVALTAASGPLGFIRLADRARPEAARVIAELRELGIQAAILTGDNASTAAAIGRELGIDNLRSGLLPTDKARAVAELEAGRGPTGMVGDGVNDAPALAAARVSLALGGVSSGVALETADIVLMADDLSPIPWTVRHARTALRRIRQNIVFAVVVKAAVLCLAVFGWATLRLAILADVGAALLVTVNSLRLLRAGDD